MRCRREKTRGRSGGGGRFNTCGSQVLGLAGDLATLQTPAYCARVSGVGSLFFLPWDLNVVVCTYVLFVLRTYLVT